MEIEVTPQFEKLYKKLPVTVKIRAEKQIGYFVIDPFYPSLNVEKLAPKTKQYWSLRIDKKYRIIFRYQSTGKVSFVAVGEHDWVYKYLNKILKTRIYVTGNFLYNFSNCGVTSISILTNVNHVKS